MGDEVKTGLAFYDLCISDRMEEADIQLIIQMGYRTLAINKILEETSLNSKKKGKTTDANDKVDCVPPCPAVSQVSNMTNSKATLLNRLTIQVGDITLLSKLNQSENIKKYDILAVVPTTQTAFNHACTTMDVDIICFDPEYLSNSKLNRKLYKQAVERGIYFEISYAKALKESSYRRNMIQRAHLYFTIGKSKNILITSGAENYFQVRAPYDIINLGRILGLNDAHAMRSITEAGRKVLLKADNRRRGKAAVFFVDSPAEKHQDEDLSKKPKLDLE